MTGASRQSGYTLIEILGAVFILTIIMTLVTGIFIENGRQRDAALSLMDETLSAIAAIDQLATDLEGSVYLMDSSERRPDEYAWRFVAEGFGDLGAENLRFVTQNAPAANRGQHASQWVEVVYFLEEDEEETKTLWRWMGPRPPTEANAPYPESDDEGSMRVAVDVAEFGLQFMGVEQEWVDEWDSAYQSPLTPLPVGVQIQLRMMRKARPGESEDGAESIPGKLHSRRVAIAMPPIDINALVGLSQDDDGETAECFTVAHCMNEGDAEWYHAQIDSDCGGDDDLCDRLIAADSTCWSEIESGFPALAARAPETCSE